MADRAASARVWRDLLMGPDSADLHVGFVEFGGDVAGRDRWPGGCRDH